MILMNVKVLVEPNRFGSLRIMVRDDMVYSYSTAYGSDSFVTLNLSRESFPLKLLFVCRRETGMFHYHTDNPDLDLKIRLVHSESSTLYYESRELNYDEVADGFNFTCSVQNLNNPIWQGLDFKRNPIDLNNPIWKDEDFKCNPIEPNNPELNGSLEFILYSTLDGENVINKTLTDRVSLDIVLKSDVSIDTPRIVLLNDGVDYSVFNYAEIPDFNRFYFIRGYDQINARMVSLELEVDVLESYKNEILTSNARFNREIRTGDFADVNIDKSFLTSISKYHSEVELAGSSIVLTTVGV